MNTPKIAICYDFDGTLSPGNMQEYDFMRKIDIDVPAFWQKTREMTEKNNSDSVLSYMRLMIEESARKGVPFTKTDFRNYGKTLPLYPGVETWFDRVNDYGKQKGLEIEHYIISSGIREMIKGHPISKNFKHIYASSFMYDEKGNAVWPAMALNYTAKTQYLFRINKGCFDINDSTINDFVPDKDRYVPLSRMVYIGDGLTDVPCMRLVKDKEGHSIAVFNPQNPKSKTVATQLLKDERVNFVSKADYEPNSLMERIMFGIIDKVAAGVQIDNLKDACKKT